MQRDAFRREAETRMSLKIAYRNWNRPVAKVCGDFQVEEQTILVAALLAKRGEASLRPRLLVVSAPEDDNPGNWLRREVKGTTNTFFDEATGVVTAQGVLLNAPYERRMDMSLSLVDPAIASTIGDQVLQNTRVILL
jgi:hypothetical protein